MVVDWYVTRITASTVKEGRLVVKVLCGFYVTPVCLCASNRSSKMVMLFVVCFLHCCTVTA